MAPLRGLRDPLERRTSAVYSFSKPKTTQLAPPRRSKPSPKEPPTLKPAEDRLKSLIVHDIPPNLATAVDKICSVIDEFPIQDIAEVLDCAARLICHDDASVTGEGYRIVDTLTHYSEFTAMHRHDLFLRIVGQTSAKQHTNHSSRLFSYLSNQGRDVEGFEFFLPALLPRLVHEADREIILEDPQKLASDNLLNSKPSSLDVLLNTIKYNAKFLGDDDVLNLVQQAFEVYERLTPLETRKLIHVFNALVTYSHVPNNAIAPLVRTLCSIVICDSSHQNISAREDSWVAFAWLMSTHLKTLALNELLCVLEDRSTSDGKATNRTVGACTLLHMALTDVQTRSTVDLNLVRLLAALGNADDHALPQHSELRLDLICKLFKNTKACEKLLVEPDWMILQTAIVANANVDGIVQGLADGDRSKVDVADSKARSIRCIVTELEGLPEISVQQSRTLRRIALSVAPVLNDRQALKLIEAYQPTAFRISIGNWKAEIRELAQHYVCNPLQNLALRQKALMVVKSASQTAHELGEKDAADLCISLMLETLPKETNRIFRGNMVHCLIVFASFLKDKSNYLIARAFITSAHKQCHDDLTHMALFSHNVLENRPSSPERLVVAAEDMYLGRQSLPSVLPDAGLVVLLMRSSVDHMQRSQFIFHQLLDLIHWPNREPEATVMVLRGLFRIRSDLDYRIFFVASPEGEGLAAALNRNSQSPLVPSRRGSHQSGVSLSLRAPVWKYGDIVGLPEDPPKKVSAVLSSRSNRTSGQEGHLDMAQWLDSIIKLIDTGCDWEVYSYIIVHLGPQLTNQSLFIEAIPQIRRLTSTICRQIQEQKVFKPPEASNLRQGDVALCLFNILTTLIGYHWHFSRSETEMMVSTFIRGLTAWDRTTVPCIHALTLCCYELPVSLGRDLARIVAQMATIVTKSEAAIHVLEFLAGMSRLEILTSRFHGDEIRTVFGVCFSYIQYARGKRYDEAQQRSKSSASATRQPSVAEAQRPSTEDIPHYVFAISYHVITYWFLALKMEDREKQLPWMEQRLLSRDQAGNIEDEGVVTLDHLWRLTKGKAMASDVPSISLSPQDESEDVKSWISQYCVLTIKCNAETGLVETLERRASGTDASQSIYSGSRMLCPEMILQERYPDGVDGPFQGTSGTLELLPVTEATIRALRFFDRTSPIDSFKAGLVYMGEAQTDEIEILGNVIGSPDYYLFYRGLGKQISLLNCRQNVAGLDTSEGLFDGPSIYQHHDTITALSYHITTLMPTNRQMDPRCTRKKSHIGNDYVNIIFNNSGRPFDFNTFPSAFNYVYIIVTPEARQTFIQTRTRTRNAGWFEDSWFKVQVITREDFPDISSAAETKVVSGAVLSDYVRNLVLNAEVFCRVWANKDKGGEYPSSWRSRLQQLRQMKERYAVRSNED